MACMTHVPHLSPEARMWMCVGLRWTPGEAAKDREWMKRRAKMNGEMFNPRDRTKDQIREWSLRQGRFWHISPRLNASPCQHIGCLSKNTERQKRPRQREKDQMRRRIFISIEIEIKIKKTKQGKQEVNKAADLLKLPMYLCTNYVPSSRRWIQVSDKLKLLKEHLHSQNKILKYTLYFAEYTKKNTKERKMICLKEVSMMHLYVCAWKTTHINLKSKWEGQPVHRHLQEHKHSKCLCRVDVER